MPWPIWVFAGRTDHFAGFVMLRLKWSQWIPVGRKVQLAAFMYLVISLLVLRAGYGIWLYQFLIIAYLFTLQIYRDKLCPLYLIMPVWNIWHVKMFLKWPNIYVKYGLGGQWLMLHNTFTVFEWANLWGAEIITKRWIARYRTVWK